MWDCGRKPEFPVELANSTSLMSVQLMSLSFKTFKVIKCDLGVFLVTAKVQWLGVKVRLSLQNQMTMMMPV